MKWTLVSSNGHYEIYELWDNKEKLLAFSYHVVHGTARIFSDEPRVFILRKEGFLKTKTALLNEYGIKMAILTEETDTHSGLIEMDRKKLTFFIHNHEVLIYSAESEKPVIVCDLPVSLSNYMAQILLLCWYKLQPQKTGLLQTA